MCKRRWLPMDVGCTCIVCGDVIPEGRQVCPLCEARAEEAREKEAQDDDGN